MLYTDFNKTIKKILIDRDLSLKDIAEKIGDSSQNLVQKLNRETIRLQDAEKILDALNLKLEIVDK